MAKIDAIFQQLTNHQEALTAIQAVQARHSSMLETQHANIIDIKALLQDLSKSVTELSKSVTELSRKLDNQPPAANSTTPPTSPYATRSDKIDGTENNAAAIPSIRIRSDFPKSTLNDSSFNGVAEITHLDLFNNGKLGVTDIDNDNREQSRPRRFSDQIVSEPAPRSSENFTGIGVESWDVRSNIVWIPTFMSLEHLEMGYRNLISEMMLISPYVSLESSIEGPKSPIIYVFPLLQTNTHPEAKQFIDLQFNSQPSFIVLGLHVLESNAMTGYEGKIFIFDPGGKIQLNSCVAQFIYSDTRLQQNLDITTSTLQPTTSDLEDKVIFERSVMIRYSQVHDSYPTPHEGIADNNKKRIIQIQKRLLN